MSSAMKNSDGRLPVARYPKILQNNSKYANKIILWVRNVCSKACNFSQKVAEKRSETFFWKTFLTIFYRKSMFEVVKYSLIIKIFIVGHMSAKSAKSTKFFI